MRHQFKNNDRENVAFNVVEQDGQFGARAFRQVDGKDFEQENSSQDCWNNRRSDAEAECDKRAEEWRNMRFGG